ncbi:MAG: YhjD/YihY/BrkB family envelope integrity protein, partial [Chloroflexota bacterium]
MSVVVRWRWVVALRRILDRYGAAGGGLLAGGLAYAALFAIVPGVVLLAGVAGLVYADPAAREQAVAVLAGVLPPLRDVVDAVLAEVARSAAPVSIVGAIALLWGTSRFVV